MIQIENLLKQYSGRVLLREVSWHIDPGARVGLVGPNGAGKTTLLRILAGEEGSDGGTIRQPRSVTIGYLPQDVAAPPEGSVLAAVLDANVEVRHIEEEMERLEAAMGGEEHDRALARYGELRHRYESLGGYALEAQARAILTGLGIAEDRFHGPVVSLSGGFRMRVALARLLLARPDLLLLDEPTNHLDLESLGWLEEFLSEWEGAFIVASHDRFFLDRMVDRIAEIDEGRLTLYPGNYEDYLEIRRLRAEQVEAQAKQQARRVAEIERFIERFRAKNTKAKQVQSRIKMLARMERVEVRRPKRQIRFSFPPPVRSGDRVIEVHGLVKRYGERSVYEGVNFEAFRGDRIALVGPNGAGKTTLLRVLAEALPFEGGERRLGHNVTFAYYAQHQLESLDPRATILEEVTEAAPDDVRPRVRGLLGLFLFSGDDVDKRIAVLSGGEKARVALCKMLLRPANLLLLDEPTNHLDLRSREVLEEALEEYAGTIVFISHDRYFITRIAKKICEVRDGRLDMLPVGYEDYVEGRHLPGAVPLQPVEREPAPSESRAAREPRPTASRPAQPRQAGPRRGRPLHAEEEEKRRRDKALKSLRTKLKTLEERIASEEESLKGILARQADPEVYRDGEQARQAAHDRRAAEEKIAWLYREWTDLSEHIEGVTAGLA